MNSKATIQRVEGEHSSKLWHMNEKCWKGQPGGIEPIQQGILEWNASFWV